MSEFSERLERGRREHGDKFDDSQLLEQFRPFYHGPRVRVEGPHGARTGVVSTTTGWRPVFILMHRSSDVGSWDVLGPDDRVVAVQHGRRYVPL